MFLKRKNKKKTISKVLTLLKAFIDKLAFLFNLVHYSNIVIFYYK